MGGVHPSFFSLGQAGCLFASASWGFQNFDRSLSNSDQGLFVEHFGGHRASLAALVTIKPIVGSA
jgi:hypothetical protein